MKQKGPGWLNGMVVGLPNKSYKLITNTAWVRARLCKLQNKCALDPQPQVLKLTSCLPMVGGSLRVLRLLPPLKLVTIIQHESLRKLISHGPKFREPQHINWKHNFKIIMDVVEDYARSWIKREVDQDPELEFLSD